MYQIPLVRVFCAARWSTGTRGGAASLAPGRDNDSNNVARIFIYVTETWVTKARSQLVTRTRVTENQKFRLSLWSGARPQCPQFPTAASAAEPAGLCLHCGCSERFHRVRSGSKEPGSSEPGSSELGSSVLGSKEPGPMTGSQDSSARQPQPSPAPARRHISSESTYLWGCSIRCCRRAATGSSIAAKRWSDPVPPPADTSSHKKSGTTRSEPGAANAYAWAAAQAMPAE